MRPSEVYEEIRSRIGEVPVVDMHEHLIPERNARSLDVGLFDLLANHYLRDDLVSSGMPPSSLDGETFDPEDGWKRIRPHIENVRATGYYRSLLLGFRDLYGFRGEEVGDANWRDLSDKIRTHAKRDGWYRFVLREKGNIDLVLNSIGVTKFEEEFFLAVPCMDAFTLEYQRKSLERLEGQYGERCVSFEDHFT